MIRAPERILCAVAAIVAFTGASTGRAQPVEGPRGEPPRTVTVVGKATGTGLKAEEEARLNAKRTAVEQVCGTWINSQTRVKDYQTQFDKIMAEASGFARIVKELGVEKADGITYVKAEIEVIPDNFRQVWKRFMMIKEGEDNPRTVLIVVEKENMTDDRPPRPNGVVQSELEGFFLSKRVRLMDKGISEDVRRRDLTLAAVNDDVNKVAAAGAAFKAEVVVLGRAEATPGGATDIGGMNLYKWRAVLTIRAIRTDSAEILMSQQYIVTKNTTTPTGGGAVALQEVVKQNEDRILLAIGEAWRRAQMVNRSIVLTVKPMDYAAALGLSELIKKLDGTAEVRLREVVQSSAEFEIEWKNKIDDLAARLMEMELEGGKLDITERTANRLFAKVMK
jgi:hypothetical protein